MDAGGTARRRRERDGRVSLRMPKAGAWALLFSRLAALAMYLQSLSCLHRLRRNSRLRCHQASAIVARAILYVGNSVNGTIHEGDDDRHVNGKAKVKYTVTQVPGAGISPEKHSAKVC